MLKGDPATHVDVLPLVRRLLLRDVELRPGADTQEGALDSGHMDDGA